MKKIKVLLFTFLLSINSAFASGIPTVDIANLTQNLTDYINQLKQYANALERYQTQASQLNQQYQDYKQKLLEYEHMLAQMKSLQQRIQDRDALSVINEAKNLYRDNPLVGYYMDEEDPDLDEAMDGADMLYGDRRANIDIQNLINSGKYSADDRKALQAEWDELYANDMLSVNQVSTAQDNTAALTDLIALRAETRQFADSMGDEDLLATLQLIVEQNQIALQMNELSIQEQNQQLLEANRLTNQLNRNRALEFQWRTERQPVPVQVESAKKYSHLYGF